MSVLKVQTFPLTVRVLAKSILYDDEMDQTQTGANIQREAALSPTVCAYCDCNFGMLNRLETHKRSEEGKNEKIVLLVTTHPITDCNDEITFSYSDGTPAVVGGKNSVVVDPGEEKVISVC